MLFASKAFPCTAVYRVLAEEGLACDVASGGELALALSAGFDPERIYMHGNAKSEAELREALAAGVGHIVLDSLDEIDRLGAIAAEAGIRQDVLIRVTPGVSGDTHQAISTGQADSKFGFSIDQARDAIAALGGHDWLDLVGLHFHIGSQLFELEPFRAAVHAIAALGDFPVYNLGGGLAAPTRPTSGRRARAVGGGDRRRGPWRARAWQAPAARARPRPGGQLHRDAVHVQTVKRNVSTWVAVDGGMSDNLRPMMYGARYEAVIADRPLGRRHRVPARGQALRVRGRDRP